MNKLIDYIKNNNNKVIGLDGPSGAGKSTIALYLEENYDVLVFHTDDYFLPLERKTKKRLEQPGGNLDYERMEKEIFENLDKDLIYSNKFNCKTNQLEEQSPIKRKSIVLIEGVYSLHPRFQKYYDLKVFLEIDKEEQLKRIAKRSGDEMLKRFIEEWIPLEDSYFADLNIEESVNLFMKNSYLF